MKQKLQEVRLDSYRAIDPSEDTESYLSLAVQLVLHSVTEPSIRARILKDIRGIFKLY